MYKKAAQYMKYVRCYRFNNIQNNIHDRVADMLKEALMLRQWGFGRKNTRDNGKMRRKRGSKQLIKYFNEPIIKHNHLKLNL